MLFSTVYFYMQPFIEKNLVAHTLWLTLVLLLIRKYTWIAFTFTIESLCFSVTYKYRDLHTFVTIWSALPFIESLNSRRIEYSHFTIGRHQYTSRAWYVYKLFECFRIVVCTPYTAHNIKKCISNFNFLNFCFAIYM